jgi:hypothetical protein
MRTVSFSNDQVQDIIAEQFVATYTNTKGDPSAGASFSHTPHEPPGPCGRGAGRQNVQIIFMTPSGEIFHVATGFLSSEDLIEEMEFAKGLFQSLDRKNSERAGQQLVAAQTQRLKRLGFTQQELQNDNPLQEMLTAGLSPSDFGMKLPNADAFGNIQRQRTLQDAKYVLRHPLISQGEFEQDPGQLVGHHKSFFGSNSAMNVFNQTAQ